MKQSLSFIVFAVFLVTFFFPVQDLYSDSLDTCLLEALKKADDTMTVGKLREQCQQDARTNSVIPVSQVNSPASSDANIMSENGPEELVLKSSQGKKPAYFPHKKHQSKYTCGTCHHGKNSSGRLARYTEELIIEKCTACHDSSMPNKELNNFKLIGHELCRECHRKNQDITSAKCSTCHRKN